MSVRNPTTLMSITNEESFDFLFKIVLIGDCGTGKTCIVQRFKSGNFIESHGNTIGVDFSMKAVTVDGKKVKVCMAHITPFHSHMQHSREKCFCSIQQRVLGAYRVSVHVSHETAINYLGDN